MILNYHDWKRLNESNSLTGTNYFVYEGQLWDGETGEVVLLEGWLSDVLHGAADVVSMAADYVIPGSGAIVDILNAVSYIVEAQFKPEEERDTLYLMAAITAAFVILPGPLQAVAIPLKSFLKGGAKTASKVVVGALKTVGGILDKVLLGLPSRIKSALNTQLGKKISGKYQGKITGALDAFTARVKKIFDKLAGTKSAASARATKKAGVSLPQRAAIQLQKLTPAFVKRLNSLATVSTLKFGGKSAGEIAAKLGIAPGKVYRYVNDAGKVSSVFVKSVGKDGVHALFGSAAKGALQTKNVVKLENFAQRVIVAPWLRRGSSVTVPFFVKRFAAMFMDDGSLSPEIKLEELEDLSADEVSSWMEANWKEDEVAYQGATGVYTVQPKVQAVQNALLSLGKQLPRFGADGKFGQETITALNQYETEKGLPLSTTQINPATATAMVGDLQASGDAAKIAIAKGILAQPTVV